MIGAPHGPRTGTWLGRFALELALWLAASGTFLFVYVRHFGVPATAILPHLRVLLALFCTVVAVRMTACAVVPAVAARTATAVLLALLATVTFAYYLLVLIGLASWGRVVSWDLIASYAAHAGAFADALGVSLVRTAILAVAVYAAVLLAAWLYLSRLDWIVPLRRAVSRVALTCIAAGAAGTAFAEWYSFLAAPPARAGEPVSLTFFPHEAAREVQYHSVDSLRAARLDASEDAVRTAYAPAALGHRRNVVLIVVDALRPDHMGVYGYARETTPFLTGLAAQGDVRKAEAMRATCSNSACGLFSLVSSKYIHEYSYRPITIHEVLRRHGYRVHLILGGDHARFYGLRELYGPVDTYFDGSMAERGVYLNDDELVLAHARTLPAWDGRPALIQFHLMSAHVGGARDPRYARWTPATNYFLNRGENDRASATNFYDNGVVQADAAVETLLGILRAKGYLADALVAVTADHGEALGEHGRYAHANGVDDEVLRIPLVLIAHGYTPPALAGAAAPTSQVDIAPTILRELGIAPPRTWSGKALQDGTPSAYVYFQDRATMGFVDARSREHPWKYWVDTRTGEEFVQSLAGGEAVVAQSLRREWRMVQLHMLPGSTGAHPPSELP